MVDRHVVFVEEGRDGCECSVRTNYRVLSRRHARPSVASPCCLAMGGNRNMWRIEIGRKLGELKSRLPVPRAKVDLNAITQGSTRVRTMANLYNQRRRTGRVQAGVRGGDKAASRQHRLRITVIHSTQRWHNWVLAKESEDSGQGKFQYINSSLSRVPPDFTS
ncbi:hypothetical protein Btru_071576 [Bulinus truncatus]|nr:hypothetical protein Btru_071576 [Bulinus truncatus]